jgi:hypothetical protein
VLGLLADLADAVHGVACVLVHLANSTRISVSQNYVQLLLHAVCLLLRRRRQHLVRLVQRHVVYRLDLFQDVLPLNLQFSEL